MLNRQQPPALATLVTELVLLCDIGIGLSWVMSAPSRSDVPALHTARLILGFLPGESMRWYGGLLAVLASAALFAMTRLNDAAARRYFAVLVPFWTFFVLIYVTAALSVPNASLTAPWVTAIVLIGHVRPLLTVDLTRRK
jgi:hypothetical protein